MRQGDRMIEIQPFRALKKRIVQEAPVKKYRYDCNDETKKVEFECIEACSREMSRREFIKNVDEKFIKKFEDKVGILLKEDYSISFYKSITPNGRIVYYFKYLSNGYIFY